MVLTVSFVLSPVSEFLFVTVVAGKTPAAWHQQRVSGPHDFAVRFQRFRPARLIEHDPDRKTGIHFSGIMLPRLTPKRPSHPAPNVRDDRETPLCVGRDAGGSR